MNKLAPLALLLSTFASASAATAAPAKVVFIGDQITYGWASALAANPNWIDKGEPGVGFWGATSTAAGVLAAFQSDVVSLHPAIVHILIGPGDADDADDASFELYIPSFLTSLEAIVREAKASDIQVVLGTLPPVLTVSGQMTAINSVIANYGAANNIPVINYGDALCGCVSSTEPPWTASANSIGADVFDQYGGGPYLVATTSDQPGQYALIPSAAGYAMMTRMAESTIDTIGLKLTSGWLSNVQQQNENEPGAANGPTLDVNSVAPAAVVQFTPIGYYSDGSQHPLLATNLQGSTGIWTSSNPVVMSVNQDGLTLALSPGKAIIRYTSPSGVAFSEWIINVD